MPVDIEKCGPAMHLLPHMICKKTNGEQFVRPVKANPIFPRKPHPGKDLIGDVG